MSVPATPTLSVPLSIVPIIPITEKVLGYLNEFTFLISMAPLSLSIAKPGHRSLVTRFLTSYIYIQLRISISLHCKHYLYLNSEIPIETARVRVRSLAAKFWSLTRAFSAPPNMQRASPQELEHAHVLEEEDRRQKCQQLKGIRLRKWGSWVSEIRMPKSREKLWLGSYPTAQQAARAYDAAVYCLRGPAAKFNFPNSVPDIPSASSLSRRQIQVAAAKYAMGKSPSSPPTVQEKENSREEAPSPSPSRSASVSEAELRSDCHQILGEDALDLWECGSDSRDSCLTLNLERMPSIDDALALELNSCVWQEEEHTNMNVDPTELWNF